MKRTAIYRVNEYSKETGMGAMKCICADKQTVINYLTRDGYRHGILSDEFDRISGDALIDYIADGMVLKFTPEKENGLYELLGRSQPGPEYYIIHKFDLLSGNFIDNQENNQ